MRRALGLDGAPSASTKLPAPTNPPDVSSARRRFVRDGEVPVTVVNRTAAPRDEPLGANRLDAARQALQSQTAAREEAERLLAEARATIRDLQTKLAHEHLARQEVAQRTQTRLHELEQAVATAHAEVIGEREQRERAEAARDKAVAALAKPQKPADRVVREASPPITPITLPGDIQPRRRGRPPKARPAPGAEESPYVEWWVPGWKEKYR